MAEEVKIDKVKFHDRLNKLVAAGKADRRAGDSIFGGVGSIVVLLGKSDDPGYQKSNALHVSPFLVMLEALSYGRDSSGYWATNFLRRSSSSRPRACG